MEPYGSDCITQTGTVKLDANLWATASECGTPVIVVLKFRGRVAADMPHMGLIDTD